MEDINNSKNKITVVLADDHSLVRDGIKSLLEDAPNIVVLGEAANGEEALLKVAEIKPDILIVDIRMPKLNGIDTVAKLTQTNTSTKALVLSMHDSEDYILKSVEAGAFGYILKDTNKEEFIKAIHTIYKGGKYFSGDISPIFINRYLENLNVPSSQPTITSNPSSPTATSDIKLTKRQKEILELAIQGLSNKEIATHLGISIRTIEAHRFSMMKKLEVKNLMELSKKAKGLGLV